MWGRYASSFDIKRSFTSEYVKSKSFVSMDRNLAAFVPCLMGVDVTFFFFPFSEAKFSSSSSDAQEKYFSA